MKIALGADHAGYALKDEIRESLRQAGYEVTDFGTNSSESTDYPDYAGPVAETVSAGKADRGILVCSTGIGMSIAANKVPGIRAALGMNLEAVQLTRAHNDSNVLALAAKFTDTATAQELVRAFLETNFEGGRHQRRVDKTMSLERKP